MKRIVTALAGNLILSLGLLMGLSACSPSAETQETLSTGSAAQAAETKKFSVQRSEQQWRQLLPPKTFAVMRHEDTERAFSHSYHNHKANGVYYCAACGQPLFDSQHKYDSGTGWPSYFQPIRPGAVGTRADHKLFTTRTEVHCSRCGGHLGHVFDDGPKPTGLRYCMNGAALSFRHRSEPAPPLLK